MVSGFNFSFRPWKNYRSESYARFSHIINNSNFVIYVHFFPILVSGPQLAGLFAVAYGNCDSNTMLEK